MADRNLTVLCSTALILSALGMPAARAALPLQSNLQLLDRYERAEFDAVSREFENSRGLTSLARTLMRQGEDWTTAAGSEAAPKRRLIAASVALELANAGLDDQWLALRSLVEWGCELIRKNPPTPAERAWHLAALALAGGARDVPLLYSHGTRRVYGHLAHAEARFPGEPRFHLARALENEIGVSMEPPRTAHSVSPLPEDDAKAERRRVTERAIAHLKPLLSSEQIAGEAALHIGQLNYGLLHLREARAAYSDALRLSQDRFVQYLAFYFAGRSYEYEARFQEAEVVYGHALELLPRAQSGVLSRAAMLFRLDRASEAYALLEAPVEGSVRPPDPWRLYGHWDYRLWPVAIASLRRELSTWR